MADEDLYALSFSIDCAGEQCLCVLGYKQDGGTNGPDTLTALCQAFIDDVVPSLEAALAADVEIDRVSVDTVTNHNDVPGVIDLNGHSGDVVGVACPAQMAMLIHLATDAPNAKHNGRIYISGCDVDSQTQGQLDAGQTVLMQTLAGKLNDTLSPTAPETADFIPVVISRFLDGVKRTPPVGFLVTTPVAKLDIRQQRRRKTTHFGYR